MAAKKKPSGGIFGGVKKLIRKVAKSVGIGMKTTHSTLDLIKETARIIRETPAYNPNDFRRGRGRQAQIATDGGTISPNEFLIQMENLRAMLSVQEATNTKRKENFNWNKTELNTITSRIQERIFRLGLNSADQQMRAPRRRKTRDGRTRNQPYRFDTGELYRSIKVKQINKSGDLDLSFTREKVVIERMIELYGDLFKFSPSDIQYVVYLYLKKTKRIPRNIKVPRIRSSGAAPYNP